MEKEEFLNLFKLYSVKETGLFFDIFIDKKVDENTICSYYQLYLDAKEIGYKYNTHVLYLPFEDANDLSESDYFIIRNKKEILLQVYFSSNYDIQRIEDNLTALYF